MHTDSILGDFIISKFYFNADNVSFQIVEQGQSRRVIYNITDITLYDAVNGGSAETFSTITALSLRLEQLNYPAFQQDGEITSIANLIQGGDGVEITGDGTGTSPYIINLTSGDALFLGSYNTLVALQTAHPIALNGSYAFINQTAAADLVYYFSTDDLSWFQIPIQLENLTDVAIEIPSNGQVLTYNDTTSKWENQIISTGTPTLQEVTDEGLVDDQAVTTNAIKALGFDIHDGANNIDWRIGETDGGITVFDKDNLSDVVFSAQQDGSLSFGKGIKTGVFVTGANTAPRNYTLPDADGTIALTTDIATPTLQEVTDVVPDGNVTTNDIILNGGNLQIDYGNGSSLQFVDGATVMSTIIASGGNFSITDTETTGHQFSTDNTELTDGDKIFATREWVGDNVTTPTLAETLIAGNETGGTDIVLNDIDAIALQNGSHIRQGTIDAGNGGAKGISQICAVGYEHKWEAGRLYIMNDGGTTIREVSHNFAVTPTVNDDFTKGFVQNSRWILDNGDVYVCTDPYTGDASWELVNTGTTPNLQQVTDKNNETTNSIKAYQLVTQTNGAAKKMTLSSTNVNTERTAEWQDKDYNGIADISDIQTLTPGQNINIISDEIDVNIPPIVNTNINLGTTGIYPYGIAIDSLGNVYTANSNSDNVTKITPLGVSTTLGTTGDYPQCIAIDSLDNVYTANQNSANLTKITPDGTSTTLASLAIGGARYSIAIDSLQNIYVACFNSNNVIKVTPLGVVTNFSTTDDRPSGIAVDSLDNVYTVNYFGQNITKITPSGVSTNYGTTGQYPYGIVVDLLGNVYTSNSGSDSVTKITPDGTSTTYGTTGIAPYGIGIDSSGNVYTSNTGSNNVTKITPAGVSTIFGTTGSYPIGITIDSLGNVYTANLNSNNVTKITLDSKRILAVDDNLNIIRVEGSGGGGGVTSVDLTMPSAFIVSGNPVTSSGTLAVTAAGVASQYIRGDGSLANFPTSTGGGSSVSYYLNGSVSQGTIGGVAYKEMKGIPVIGEGTDFTINADGYIAQFITDVGDPNKLLIPAGNWNFETYFSSSSTGGSPRFYIELYKYDGTTFTQIASNSATPEYITGGTAIDLYFTALAVPETTLLATDRLAVRFYVIHSSKTIKMHTEDSHLSQIITTFSTGLTALNGLTQQTQYFDEGTAGTDFNISSIVDIHTFNLPTASATNRGALSTTDWTTFNNKQNASTRRNANNSSNNNINYCGVALGTGVSESSAVWTITRLTIAASGSITTATATNVAWTNRESVIY